MDCSSPYAMASLIEQRDRFRIATGNDADADRHGIVTPDAGLINPYHYLSAAISYLYSHRDPVARGHGDRQDTGVVRHDRQVAADLGRQLVEVPVGFKWFVDGLVGGSLGFGGEESAGASFLRRDGSVWTTDKDGIILALLASEITAVTGKTPSEHYTALTARFGAPCVPAHRRPGLPRGEGAPRESARTGQHAHPRRRSGHRGAHPCSGQRRAHRRHQGDHRQRLVRGPSVGHRGC